MITKNEIRKCTADWCEYSEDYAEIAENRPEWKHQIFVLDDHLYFEFWDKHEFEFTIYGEMSDKAFKAYSAMAFMLNLHASMNEVAAKDVAEFVGYCKKELAQMSRKIA